MMKLKKGLKDFTIEDAEMAYEEYGLACICADGKLKNFNKERRA